MSPGSWNARRSARVTVPRSWRRRRTHEFRHRHPPLRRPFRVPTLVLFDLQQEYVASERLLAIEETKGALENCRAALAHARAMGLPVAFARWIDRTPLFNKATRFSRWIEGFEPHGVT